ncbi:hypothetical protein E4U53_000062 [Claviceps sorghi]|nr:hypothetical protein E4U53_000062 [Claviceps sorghi]
MSLRTPTKSQILVAQQLYRFLQATGPQQTTEEQRQFIHHVAFNYEPYPQFDTGFQAGLHYTRINHTRGLTTGDTITANCSSWRRRRRRRRYSTPHHTTGTPSQQAAFSSHTDSGRHLNKSAKSVGGIVKPVFRIACGRNNSTASVASTSVASTGVASTIGRS